ncbi:hypothetical protein Tco_0411474 [Tanacetum coccineum]
MPAGSCQAVFAGDQCRLSVPLLLLVFASGRYLFNAVMLPYQCNGFCLTLSRTATPEGGAENCYLEDTYLDLTGPDEVFATQPGGSPREEVSTLHTAFQDFKEKAEAQQEEQAQVLYNHVAELEAHVMDVSNRLEGEFYPTYLTTLAGRRWFLKHGIQLAVLKCFKSPEYQGILVTPWAIEAYNLEAARTSYFDAVRTLEDVDFPLLSVPIHHSDDKAIVGETSLSFAFLNVHSRAEGAKKHVVALRQLMMEIVSNPCLLRLGCVKLELLRLLSPSRTLMRWIRTRL